MSGKCKVTGETRDGKLRKCVLKKRHYDDHQDESGATWGIGVGRP